MLAGKYRLIRLFRVLAGAAFVSAAATAVAHAGPVADQAAIAEQKAAAGDAAAAGAAFDRATDAFWIAAPLTFRVATFADNVTGFGKYTPHLNVTFHAGDSVTIYLEPIGYGFAIDAGNYRVSYGTALEIRTPGGLILGKSDDFGTLTWTGRSESHEVHAAVTVALPASLKPGDYQLLLTLKDEASTKSATATLPFSIAE